MNDNAISSDAEARPKSTLDTFDFDFGFFIPNAKVELSRSSSSSTNFIATRVLQNFRAARWLNMLELNKLWLVFNCPNMPNDLRQGFYCKCFEINYSDMQNGCPL